MVRRLLILLSLALVLLACQREPVGRLLFTTLGQSSLRGGDDLGNTSYQQPDAALFIAATPEEARALANTVLVNNPDLVEKLQTQDYDRYFAVLAIQGYIGSNMNQIEVTEVHRDNDVLTLQAIFLKPDTRVNWVATTPYHLIVLPKLGPWNEEITFRLFDQAGELRAERTHFIP